ncbi:chloride channel protein [Seongchinamella sediminis]|uniref:Chloride channel protein n=1 Tax=Seongchinamella sediminis TaxID=2283635 RepID=A0A3L7DU71_9GAMM|nr:chloride channel protein [Seongchinamella sediminis]RLQ21128.1 chloride channel protein [Seongchinamella sediminis]
MRQLINNYRRYLSNYDSVLAYSLLGVIGGLASGLLVLAFEQAIIQLAALWDVGDNGDGFESLAPEWRFALPVAGALLLGLGYHFLSSENREVGIVHVLSRMHSHYGVLPARNAVLQFFAGAFALASGQSGGREGPGVHLGGAVNSLLGQRLQLPNNSLRVLIACGTAGGIAAAFNTPLAGVIFAMEVIIAEYTVAGFIPVVLAAVSASAVSRTLTAGGVAFSIPPVQLASLWEIPYIAFLGFCCGLAVVIFIQISKHTARLSHRSVIIRFTAAGIVTGLLALLVPQVLGMGYDTLSLALDGQLALMALLVIAAAKVLATAITVGVGLPVGVIGPSLLIGACIGGAVGLIGQLALPELASDPTLYIIVGMGAAMGAVMNAPLAAILAVIELTHSMNIAMPAMLAIVAATLTSSGIFRQRALHQTILRQLERAVPSGPLNQLLHSTHVGAIMDSRVVRVPASLSPADREPLLEFSPTWCLVGRDGEDLYLVQGQDLLAWLAEQDPDTTVEITEADIRRWTLTDVPVQASLRQAMDNINKHTVEAVCVYERSRSSSQPILHGVITRESIEKFTLSRL